MELTKHRSALLLVLVSLFAASHSASLFNSQPEFNLVEESSSDNQCAQTCSQLYSQVQYQQGKTYTYNVDLITRIAQQASDDEQEVKISAHADIAAYSPCELVLKLRKVHLSGVQNHARMAKELEQESLHFAYEDGKIVDICGSPSDDKWVVDVKKSIISALQMSSSDVSQKQTVIETDISGQCETIYEPIEQDSYKTVIRKVKQMNKCGQRHQFNTAFFPRSYGLEQALRSSLPFVSSNATNECTQVIKNQIVEQVECQDRTRVWPLGVQVSSKISVQLLEKKPSLQVERLSAGFRKHRLTMSPYEMTFQSERRQGRAFSVNEVQQLLRLIGQHVQTSVQQDVPVLFSQLVQALYTLAPQDQAQLWEQVRTGELARTQKLVDLFLDASALAGNEGSAAVLIRAYQQQQISQQRANYLFGLLAFARQPTVGAVQRLVQFVQQQQQQQQQLVQIPRGVIFGITGFVHNLQIVQQQTNQHNPQVDQLVQTLANLLVQTLQQNIGQVSSQVQEHQLLTISYALRNLILVPGQQQREQDQPQIAQQLVQILRQVPYNQYNQEIRVAIVRTLAIAGIDDQIRQYLLEHVIPNTQEGIEIQIEAYRAVVLSGATQQQLEAILAFTEQVSGQPQLQDLVNYIRSHQANLRTTSDPQKQTILPVNAPVFPRPSGQFLGISRNYEISYVNQGLNVGVTAETDIIYDPQQTNQFAPVPQTVSFNLTIPIGGAELQLVEVRLHQHGLEPVIARQLAQIKRSNEKDPWKVAKETVEYIFQHGAEILAENPQVHLLLQISIDGKTVVLIDEQDLISGEIQEQTFVQELMHSLRQQVTIDRAFAITPIDTVIAFPSVNGLPVQVRVNSSVVFGLRTDLNFDVRDFSNAVVQFAVWPSVASQVETAVEFQAGTEQKSIELIQSFYSAPQLNLVAQVTAGRKISLKFDLPEEQYILARVESQLYTRNQHGQRVRIAQRSQEDIESFYGPNVHVCTQATNNPLGVALCYDFSYSAPNAHSIDVIAQLSVVRTDPSLKSYEIYIESPYSIEKIFASRGRNNRRFDEQSFGQLAPFKFVFNTPGSQIDREIILEVELPNSGSDLQKEARLRVQTPWKKVLAQATVRTEPKERVASVQVSVDDEKFLQMELALEANRRGPKTEYRSRMILAMDSVLERPVNLEGVLVHSHGRKSMIHFQLEDTQAKRQYIQGTYVRDRGDGQSALATRSSADVMISLAGLNAKVAAAFELAQQLIKLDLSTEYQLPSWDQKEQARIAFKLQNMSSGKTIKLSNFGLVKISQFPKYHVRFSQNLLYVPSEQMEQDLKLGWADDEEQIRLYQAVKKTGQRGKFDIESQSIVVYRPNDVNYEVRGTAALVGFGVVGGQKRYEIQLNGQSRGQQSDESAFQAQFAYNHISKSPLEMKMRATLKTQELDFVYSDEIKEQTPGKYHGHVLIQTTPEQKFSANYVYEVKGKDKRVSNFDEHELNLEFTDSQTQRTWRKHGLLRMEADKSWLVRSKLSSDDAGEIYDGELKRLAEGKTQFFFNHIPQDIRAKFAFDSSSPSTRNGQWELSTPSWRHESQYEIVPQRSWQFNSKTKRNAENWLEIESKADKIARTQRFALNSKPFEGELQWELPEEAQQKAQLRVQMPQSWSHLTSLTRQAQKPYITLDSRTKYGQRNIADLAAKYDPQDEHYFRLNTPLARTDLNVALQAGKKSLKNIDLNLEAGQYSHQSKLFFEPKQDDDEQTEFDFESSTRKSGQPLANLRYKLADNVHNIELDSPQFVKASAECNLARTWLKPYASVNAKWTNKYGQQLQHESKLTGRRNQRGASAWDIDGLEFDSQTMKQNQNLAQIQADLSKQWDKKSFAKIRIGDHIKSNIELEPFKSASVKVDCPEFDHLTEIAYQPLEQQGKGDWRVQSQTIALKNQNKKYLFNAEHQRNRRSAFQIEMPQFDSQLAYEHPLSDLSNHQMQFQFTGKSMESPLTHKTQMRWLNQNAQKPQIQIDSQTWRKSQGQDENILAVEGAYNHNNSEMPSNLKLKLGQSLSGDLDFSFFNPNEKSVTLTGQLKDARFGPNYWNHKTQARFQPISNRLSIESNTEKDGLSLAKLDTLLSGNSAEKSFFNLKAGLTKPMKAQMEFEPRKRRAVLDLDLASYQHRTEFDNENGPYKLKTVTTRGPQNVLDIDSEFFPTTSERSYLKVKANSPRSNALYQGELSIHPQKRWGQLSLRTDNLDHSSLFSLEEPEQQGKSALFQTNTQYKNQMIAKIDARLRGLRGENSIEAQLPQWSAKSMFDMPTRKGSFDVMHRISRRHLLGSVAVNQLTGPSDKSFHFDLAWDVDRDPNSKVEVDLTAKRIPSQSSSSFMRRTEDLVVIASAQYGASKLVFNSEFVPEQLAQNPIRVSFGYVPLDQARISESWQLIYSHTMQDDSQYQCKWDFLVGEQLKYGLQLTGQVTGNRFQFGAQTIAPQRPDMQVTFNLATGMRKPNEQYYLEATAVRSESNRYQVVFDLTKHLETRKLDGTLELRFPNFEVHVVAFTIDLVQKQFKLDVTNEKTGKQVDVEASYTDGQAHLSAVSNIPFFPAVDAKIRYVPGEIVHAKLDLDQQRKFEFTAKYTGELSTLQFYVLTKVDSVYTPSVEFVAEGTKPADLIGSHQRSVTITGKYNMVPIVSATFQQEDVQQWVAQGQISLPNGEKIVDTSVQAIPQPSAQQQQKYLVTVTPTQNQYLEPFVATIEEQQPSASNGYVRQIKIVLNQPAKGQVAAAQIALKHRQWTDVPQMIEVTLEHFPSNSHGSFRLSVREQIDAQRQQSLNMEPSLFDTIEQTTGVSSKRVIGKVLDQAIVSWNQKAAGFSMLTTEYGFGSNAVEHDFKLYSPSRAGRVIQVRCAHQMTSTLFFIKQQLKTDLDNQREPLYQYTVLVQNQPQSGEVTAKVQLESFKFARSPKTVEFTMQKPTPVTPVNVKVRLDVGQSESQAVIIKTVVQKQPSQNQQVSVFGTAAQNQTVHFSAKTQDRTTLDFEVDAHVSDSSVGLVWQNLNRRGQRQQGQYLVRFVGQNRFEAVIANPSQRYIVQGVYQLQGGQGPLVMDFVVSKLVMKQNTWAGRTPEPVLAQEHKVHIESVDKCIRAEIEDAQSQQQQSIRQVNICLDLTRSSLVQVEIDSIKNGRKNVEFNARLDSRSVAQALQLSLKWNPKYSRQILATLLQLNQQSQQTLSEQLNQQELIQELVHKYTVIGQKLAQDFALEPLYKIVIEEFMPIAEEFGITQQLMQKWAQIALQPVEQVLQIIKQYLSENIEEAQKIYQEMIQKVEQQCQRSRTCSRLVQIVSQIQNTEDLARFIAEPLVQLLQKTHRIVAHSQGKLIQQLPEINIEQFIPDAVQDFVAQLVETAYGYVREVLVNPQTGTTAFSGIWQHIEVIAQQLVQSAQWRQVDLQRIQQALEQAVQLLVSPRSWVSSVRVLVWDPQQGQLQMEIKSPANLFTTQDNQTYPTTTTASPISFWTTQKNIINRPRSNWTLWGQQQQQQQQPQQYNQGPLSFLISQATQEQQQPSQKASYWSQWRQQQQQQQQAGTTRNTGRYI